MLREALNWMLSWIGGDSRFRKRQDDRIPTLAEGAIWTLNTGVAGTRVTRRDLQRY